MISVIRLMVRRMEYLLLSHFEEGVIFEYHITIHDEDFNLGVLTMKTPEGVFEVDFDAE